MNMRAIENLKGATLLTAFVLMSGFSPTATICHAETCTVVEYPDRFEAICEGNAPSSSRTQTKLPTTPVLQSRPPEVPSGQSVVPNNTPAEKPKLQTTNASSPVQTGRRVRPSPAIIENARASRNKLIDQHLQNAPEKIVPPQQEMVAE